MFIKWKYNHKYWRYKKCNIDNIARLDFFYHFKPSWRLLLFFSKFFKNQRVKNIIIIIIMINLNRFHFLQLKILFVLNYRASFFDFRQAIRNDKRSEWRHKYHYTTWYTAEYHRQYDFLCITQFLLPNLLHNQYTLSILISVLYMGRTINVIKISIISTTIASLYKLGLVYLLYQNN